MRVLDRGIELRSLSEQVFDHVRERILTGEYKTGERISEERIALELGVSRTPIREALRKLNEYGLVSVKARVGATVARVAAEDAKHIALVRAELEGLAGRLVAARMDEDIASELRTRSDECRACLEGGNMAATFVADSDLHLAIARLSGNPFLYDCLKRLDARIQLLRVTYCGTAKRVGKAMDEHMAIVSALSAGDGDLASRLLSDHSRHWHNTEDDNA